jgi:hypothetical protein
VGLEQDFSEYFSFPCNRRSLHQLLHNHPHVSSRECTIGQRGRSGGTYRDLGDLKQRDLRNQNLGDLRGFKFHPTKKTFGVNITSTIKVEVKREAEVSSKHPTVWCHNEKDNDEHFSHYICCQQRLGHCCVDCKMTKY